MAFITATPLLRTGSTQRTLNVTPRRSVRASAAPEPPVNFSSPNPRRYFVRPDKAVDIASLGLAGLLRLGSGALIEGYRLKRENGQVKEYSATLPKSRPNKPLHLFEFEACPYCRRVREAVTMLDLDVIFFPCPKNGLVYRKYVMEKGGKARFPYMEDPNTGFAGYESTDIIQYLYKTYGPADARVPIFLGPASVVSSGLASSVRLGKGRARAKKAAPAKQLLELWAYEASPFCKLVRETLNDLEIAHLVHTTARGSPTRDVFKQQNGRFQVPYLIDPNTGVSMWESAEICEYLRDNYGPDADNAVDLPDSQDVYMPGDPIAPELKTDVPAPSLDPTLPSDPKLEKYCEDNPEADECRMYED